MEKQRERKTTSWREINCEAERKEKALRQTGRQTYRQIRRGHEETVKGKSEGRGEDQSRTE